MISPPPDGASRAGPAAATRGGGGPRRAWLMWSLGAAAYLAALFHRMSLSVAALPAERRLGVNPETLATLSALELALYLVLQVPSGLAADAIGPRTMLAAGLSFMAAGSALFALAHAYPLALAGRGLIGIGDAFIFVNVLRLAQAWFPASRYAMMAALTGMIGGVGQLVTTAPLALALSAWGWGTTFLTAAGLTLAMGIAVALWLRNAPLMRETPRSPTRPPAPPSLRAASLRSVWSRPETRLGLWAHFVLMGSFLAFTALWGQPYLVQSEGLGAGQASLLLAYVVVSFIVAAPLAGRLASRAPGRRGPLVKVAGAMTAVSWALLAGWPGHMPLVVLVACLSVLGAAGGVGMVAFDIARSANPGAAGGAATGVVNVGGFGFAVAAELIVGQVLQSLAGGHAPAPSDYAVAFGAVCLMTLGGLAGVVAAARRCAATPAPQSHLP
ncbi:MAG: MFS transporter [Acidimicrobiales bacterium]